jgi:hypothetical protein
MKPIDLKNLTLYGELAMRINLNFARLETGKYWPESIFGMDKNSWPADWEGRTMLALTMLAQSAGRTPAFLDEIVDETQNRLNEKGYIGMVYPDGVTHEQAMAGHSWMIRAMTEYFNWKKDSEPQRADKAMTILKSIVHGLYIPQTENYRNYPVNPVDRYNATDWILSEAKDPNWKAAAILKKKSALELSDVGCAFIAIDGATAAYELLRTDELKRLIEAMIDSYQTLPLEELHVQTHATLSGIRGILRWHRITSEQKYLDLADKTFNVYKAKALTDLYGNYNWFGVPRWTEPCAIIDSFMIAQQLWEITGREDYLKDAHHILYNAIAHAERLNGAFGTDSCVGAKIALANKEGKEGWGESDQAILFAKALTYEVFWCCNMRGGDGLSCAAMYSFYTDGRTVIMPYFYTCKAELKLTDGVLKLHEKADYPFSGKVVFQCLENTAGEVMLKFFAPDAWTSGAASGVRINGAAQAATFENGFVCVSANLKAGDNLVIDSEIKFYTFDHLECVNNSPDHFSFRHGPMMLGVKSAPENDPVEINISRNAVCKPIGHGRYETTTADGKPVVLQPMWGKENMIEPADVYQMLFKKQPAGRRFQPE